MDQILRDVQKGGLISTELKEAFKEDAENSVIN